MRRRRKTLTYLLTVSGSIKHQSGVRLSVCRTLNSTTDLVDDQEVLDDVAARQSDAVGGHNSVGQDIAHVLCQHTRVMARARRQPSERRVVVREIVRVHLEPRDVRQLRVAVQLKT